MTGGVNDQMADLVAQPAIPESENPDKDITVINSPGLATAAYFGTMKTLKCDVVTIITGMAASMGSFIACLWWHQR